MSTALAAIRDLPKHELVKKAQSAAASVTRYRNEAKRVTEATMSAAAAAGGGVAVAWADANQPQVLGMDTDLVIAGAGLAAAFLDMGGKYSEVLGNIGSGAAAVAAYKRSLPHFRNKK